ncbi:hypothetical protein [Cellulomonas composti]|uniref:Uncharacterized protein n=1 Tax=Cellulomonas composti TaxID=266130 RepID=A0A511JB81_9CELL|nr:hypothetical protein [Cellulomonas composti]GEL95049.1 hypothetical protein CCO02nite_17070 [Cellulomonas composti]
MSLPTTAPAGPGSGPGPVPTEFDTESIVTTVEKRVVARLERWRREELDDHVLQLVERRLEEETERRSWRRGTEVF